MLRLFPRRKLVDPRNFQPPLPVPQGYQAADILDRLVSISIDGSAAGELKAYANGDFERFLRTLALVPEDARGRLLEVGANPYFTTLLLRWFRPRLELELLNYFGPAADSVQEVVVRNLQGETETVPFAFRNLNIESETLPYPDGHFDHIVFCEVLEHLTNDPLRSILELKRVLKVGGHMVLTTPNAARLENVIAFIEGRNIYDPYSAYGPYGRHNREYTRHELHLLMEHAGFEVEESYTGNVHGDIPNGPAPAAKINAVLRCQRHRDRDLGQYFFTRWRNVGAADPRLPRWLYRSYPETSMA